MKTKVVHTRKLALVIIFSALGVAIAPLSYFMFLGTKANPTQHAINAILGVLLGPFWAAIAAIFIGTIRYLLGIGSPYAFPGGIPGGLIVGSFYWLLKRLRMSERNRSISALAEPIGTLLIGVPIALFLFAPWLGTPDLIDLAANEGALFAFLIFGAGWAVSCIPGCIIGFIVLLFLRKMGINRETLFGEK